MTVNRAAGGVLVVEEGARSPSEHYQGALEQGT